MTVKGSLPSRRLLVGAVGLAMVAGFALGFAFLTSNGTWVPNRQVLAEEKPIVVPAGVFELQNTYRAITKAVLPAIVELSVEVPASAESIAENPPFEYFFRPQTPEDSPEGEAPKPNRTVPKSTGLGSGVMIQRQGDRVFILTNNHVIDKAQKITVKLSDQREYPGTLVGADARRDLALVSIQTTETNLVLAKLGDSTQLEVGDFVLAMGSPLGLEFSVTSGIVSALGRQGGPDEGATFNNYIQTDASINRGNSGGALVNLRGEVVGINTWIASPNGASVGLGFAIPINSTKKAIADFLAGGAVKYGWLGASVQNVTREVATDLKLPSTKGSLIPHVFKGSPAERAGILPGDFVIAIDGQTIDDTNRLIQTVGDLPAGAKAEFTLIRQGQTLKKTVTIDVRPAEKDLRALKLWPGFLVRSLTDELRTDLELAAGTQGLVVVNLEAKSTGDIAGLKVGDVIKTLNGKAVTNLADFYRELSAGSGEVKIGFVREGVELSIGITR